MRFSCEHCGKKYVVKDDLLPGRTYKSRCKGCGNIIVVKGSDDGSATADDMAVVPMSDTPAATPRPPAAPTPPRTSPPPPAAGQKPPRAPPPTAATPPPTPPAPSKPRDDRYIDLFDGLGFDDPAPGAPKAPAPAPDGAPGFPNEPVRRVSATVIPPPTAAGAPGSSADPDPFVEAARAAPVPVGSSLPMRRPGPPPAAPRRRIAPYVIGGVAAALVGALAVLAVLRPWRAAPPAGTHAAPPATAVAPEPRPPVAEAPPKAVPPPPPPQVAPPPATPAPEPPKAAEAAPQPPPEPREDAKPSARKKPEVLSAAAVRKVLTGAHKTFNRCVENPSRGLDKPLPAHRISLRLSVEPSGTVSAVAISDPAVTRAPVGHCLKTAAMALAFPAYHGAPGFVDATVDIPATPAPKTPPPATVAKAEPPPPPPPPAKAEPPPVVPVKAEAPPPAEPPPPPGPAPFVAVEFAGVSRARSGGEVGDTRYSQNADDAEITERTFENGMLTYTGQVGLGHGSSYAGIGMYMNVQPGGRPFDATKYKYLTIKLASPTTSRLRVKIQGPDQAVAGSGCYPIVMLSVSENVKTYKVKLDDFAPESFCGNRGRSAADTLPQLVSFEVADIAVQRKPTKISVGSIVLHP